MTNSLDKLNQALVDWYCDDPEACMDFCFKFGGKYLEESIKAQGEQRLNDQ